jgi:hypothetical protein
MNNYSILTNTIRGNLKKTVKNIILDINSLKIKKMGIFTAFLWCITQKKCLLKMLGVDSHESRI